MKPKAVLDLPIIGKTTTDTSGWSVRKYFQELLHTLYKEGEGFSGKRPFGNSGWDVDLAETFIYFDIISGRMIDGEPEPDNWDDYYQKVQEIIMYL